MSFKEIYGHENQIRILQTAMRMKRVPHAYLFYGMKGIGKRTLAEVFAKALNCLAQRDFMQNGRSSEGVGFDSCDQCLSCVKADRSNHPDIMTVKADGQFIRIKEIREVQEQMKFAPVEKGLRVFLMIDADRMNNVSANALLKTLEEPSRSNLLILITSSPHQLPVTILSRCQRVRFNPLQKETIASFLQDRLSMEPKRALAVASSSGGSVGKALELSDDSSVDIWDKLFPVIYLDHAKDPLKFLSLAAAFGQEKEEITNRLNLMLTLYRDALLFRETGDEHLLMNQQCSDVIKSVACGLTAEEIFHNVMTVNRAVEAIELSANKQLTLEVMLFKLIRSNGEKTSIAHSSS